MPLKKTSGPSGPVTGVWHVLLVSSNLSSITTRANNNARARHSESRLIRCSYDLIATAPRVKTDMSQRSLHSATVRIRALLGLQLCLCNASMVITKGNSLIV